MKRCEVWLVNFDPSVGGEMKKVRPAVIVSNDSSNRHLNRLQVVPFTSNKGRLYPSEAVVDFGENGSKAMADQLTSCSKKRFIRKVGMLTPNDMRAVEDVIRVQLGL